MAAGRDLLFQCGNRIGSWLIPVQSANQQRVDAVRDHLLEPENAGSELSRTQVGEVTGTDGSGLTRLIKAIGEDERFKARDEGRDRFYSLK